MKYRIKQNNQGYYIQFVKFGIFKFNYKVRLTVPLIKADYISEFDTSSPYLTKEVFETVYFKDKNQAWLKAIELKEANENFEEV